MLAVGAAADRLREALRRAQDLADRQTMRAERPGRRGVAELLERHEVLALFSPPRWPRCNGSIEAGIGSLKRRTELGAARAGHAGYWTWDDVEGARQEANTLARPRGPHGPCPEELWSARTAISVEERAAFRACVEAFQAAARIAAGSCVGGESGVRSGRGVAREAIRFALQECGYLQYRRRSIPPPLPRQKTDAIPSRAQSRRSPRLGQSRGAGDQADSSQLNILRRVEGVSRAGKPVSENLFVCKRRQCRGVIERARRGVGQRVDDHVRKEAVCASGPGCCQSTKKSLGCGFGSVFD